MERGQRGNVYAQVDDSSDVDVVDVVVQVLLVANNKLACLPDDMGKLESLLELDASCNEMTRLPRSLARLKNLKALHLRSNLLTELPIGMICAKIIKRK